MKVSTRRGLDHARSPAGILTGVRNPGLECARAFFRLGTRLGCGSSADASAGLQPERLPCPKDPATQARQHNLGHLAAPAAPSSSPRRSKLKDTSPELLSGEAPLTEALLRVSRFWLPSPESLP